MAEVVANGLRLHVQRLGDAGAGATPVVFLHGLVMDNLSSWYFSAATAVARDVPVVLYDLRGHGRSERPATGYTVADMVDDLGGLLDALGVDGPVGLVGNSFGGLLAIAFAVAHPERVSRIALVDAHVSAAGWSDAMAATLELRGDARDRKIAEAFADWLGRHSQRKRTRLADNARALVHGTSLVADLRASAALTPRELRDVRCPVLALYGERSDVLHRGRLLAEALPACELRVIPGCTHSLLWEATSEVRDALVAWFAREGAR